MSNYKDPDFQREQEKNKIIKSLGTKDIFTASFGLIYELIAIVGIAKENRVIVYVYLVFSIISIIIDIYHGHQIGMLYFIAISLTAFYAFMISRRDGQVV